MSVVDPRLASIKKNLGRFKLILPVMSPKGGVGKTFVTALLAHILSHMHTPVSLLDADLTNPTLHIVLGLDAKNLKVAEDRGIKPFKVNEKLELMSLAFFVDDYSIPLRGKDVENVVRELLAVTRWGGSVLLIDTPPGFSDTHLELLKMLSAVNRAFIILVTTPGSVALRSIGRIVKILALESMKFVGVLGNMCTDFNDELKVEVVARKYGIAYLGCVPFIDKIEAYFGSNLVSILKDLEPLSITTLKHIEKLFGG